MRICRIYIAKICPMQLHARYTHIRFPCIVRFCAICYVAGSCACHPTSQHSCIYKRNTTRQSCAGKIIHSFQKKQKQEKDVHISHRAPQARLQRLRIPPEQPHHARPTQARKHRPAIPLNSLQLILAQSKHALPTMLPIRTPHKRIRPRRLHRQLRQRQHHPRKHINANLLIHTTRRPPPVPKNPVPAKQASQERVHVVFFAAVQVFEE